MVLKESFYYSLPNKLLNIDMAFFNNNGYQYMHFSPVRFGIEIHYRRRLPIIILMMVKDARHFRTSDALLGIVCDSMANGLVIFDSSVNFSLSL